MRPLYLHNESFQTIGYATTGVSEGQYNFDDDDIGFKIFGGYNFGFIPLLDLAVEGS
jgi:outer membrane immunogenic protein